MKLIEKSRGKNLTLAAAAKISNMSRSYFSKEFHEMIGTTFEKYCLRIRISEAIKELRRTDKKLDVIARTCGFSDASHLVRTFKQVVHQTPDDYRRTWRTS